MPDDDLPFGLYERLITTGLKSRLLRFDSERTRVVRAPLDSAEAHVALARHVESVVSRALRSVPHGERLATQAAITNDIIRLLLPPPGTDVADDEVAIPPEELRVIQALTGAMAVRER